MTPDESTQRFIDAITNAKKRVESAATGGATRDSKGRFIPTKRQIRGTGDHARSGSPKRRRRPAR